MSSHGCWRHFCGFCAHGSYWGALALPHSAMGRSAICYTNLEAYEVDIGDRILHSGLRDVVLVTVSNLIMVNLESNIFL